MDNIYAVYKRRDTIEGPGCYITDSFFRDGEKAWAYVNRQKGVMGKKPKGGDWRNELDFPHWTVDVLTHEKMVELAMAKLSERDKMALGLESNLVFADDL